jgi:hypothetical protein
VRGATLFKRRAKATDENTDRAQKRIFRRPFARLLLDAQQRQPVPFTSAPAPRIDKHGPLLPNGGHRPAPRVWAVAGNGAPLGLTAWSGPLTQGSAALRPGLWNMTPSGSAGEARVGASKAVPPP